MDAAEHLVKKCGADKVYIIATHGVLSGDAIQKIEACDSVYKVKHSSFFSFIHCSLSPIKHPFTNKRLIVGCYKYFSHSQGKDGSMF